MRIKEKLKNRSGFTLAETLLAVLILLLVSVIVANGIPVAQNVYNNVIIGANAQVLLSTTVTALRNELGTAQKIEIDSNNNIIYYKAEIGAYSMLSPDLVDDGKHQGIQLLEYVYEKEDQTADKKIWEPIPNGDNTRTSYPLVSNAASNKDLYITYSAKNGTPAIEIDPSNPDVIIFHNLEVKRNMGSRATIASLDELKIRLTPVSPNA